MSISKRLRFLVLRRDRYACVYCGRRAPFVTLEIDHRIPRCRGGKDEYNNLVAACWDCNRGKGPVEADGCGHLEDLFPDDDYPIPEYPDELPKWMLPPRERHHSNFNFDLQAAAAELAEPHTVTILTTEALYELASTFDPFSEPI